MVAAAIGLLAWFISNKLLISYLPLNSIDCPSTMECTYTDYRPAVYSIIIGIAAALLSLITMRLISKKK